MISSNVNKALQASLWVAEMFPMVMPAEWGNRQLGALQLAIDVNSEEIWANILVGISSEFLEAVGLWMIETGQDEHIAVIRRVVEHYKMIEYE